MAWTAPMTASSNSTLTAAQWNAHVRDNLLETLPAKATTDSGYFVTSAANAMVQRTAATATVATSETTTSTSYTDLTTSGPAVTVTTGTQALVMIGYEGEHSTATGGQQMSMAVSGATTRSASDDWCLEFTGIAAANQTHAGTVHLAKTLTAGSNTFTAKYRTGSGTATFLNRTISVIPF